jgi:hypothetical protein
MRGYSFWACLAALALAAGTRAQEGYTIKLKHGPDPGKSVVVKSKEKGTDASTVTDADGKTTGQKRTIETEEVYTETVLEGGDKKPRKFKRSYEKASQTADGKTVALPHQGRTVLFELKDGKYQATAEGTPALDRGLIAFLAGKADATGESADDLFLPRKPVKAGDRWAVEGKALAEDFARTGAMVIDPDKSKSEVTLTKVYDKDGKRFGVLEVRTALAIKQAMGLTFATPAAAELRATLDVVIDGSSPAGKAVLSNKQKGKGTATDPAGKKFTVDLDVEESVTKEQSAEK